MHPPKCLETCLICLATIGFKKNVVIQRFIECTLTQVEDYQRPCYSFEKEPISRQRTKIGDY